MDHKQLEVAYLLKWKPDICNMALDLGCGEMKVDPSFIGVDRFKGQTARPNGTIFTANPDVICDVNNLPYEDGTIDYIVNSHTLEHMTNPVLSLDYWIGKLRVGGRIAVIVPDWRYTWSCENDESRYSPDGHKHDFTPNELERVFCSIRSCGDIKILDISAPTINWSIGGALEKLR
jgi:predicted SAM-dependent methyltransferase